MAYTRVAIASGLPSPSWLPWSVSAVAVFAPAEDPHRQISDQLKRADTANGEKRYSDAAQLYADAYRMTTATEDYRGTDIALEAVVHAMEAYHVACEGNRDYVSCRASKELLAAFILDWEASGSSVPVQVLDELRWLEEQLAQVPPPLPAETVEPVEPATVATADSDEDQEAPPKPTKKPAPKLIIDDPERRDPPAGKALGIAFVVGGAVTTVGGAVLMAVGAPLEGRADRYRSEVFGSPSFTQRPPGEQAIIVDHLDRYVGDERDRGTALMATAGAALGLGVAAIVVGSFLLGRPGLSTNSGARAHLSPRRRAGRGTAYLGLSLAF